ncbi:U-box domain-containing protein 26-like [Curcuma longa]|uniref:U-box domain-containing protein 26-like n=1 Tax=Curcuma longa TaxID=136217 RepID=UPI003D9DDF88
MSIPHLFRCPISLEIFTDPVTLSTGQTYDRPSIEKWLADGNLTCPVTMQRLTDTTLIPNHALCHLIDQWLLADPGDNCHDSLQFPDAADFSLVALRRKLLSPTTLPSEKLEMARRVHVLSVESDVGRACLVQLGFFPLLLQLLFRTPGGTLLDSEFAGALLSCVLSLSVSAPLDPLNMLKEEESTLSSLVHLLDLGNAEIKISTCHLFEVIASSSATHELCSIVVDRSPRVLQILVSMLGDKSSTFKASQAAVRATAALCSYSESNRRRAIGEGAVDGLIAHLLSNCCARRNAAPALAALELLLGLEAGRKALLENPSGVRALVKMVFRVSTGHEGSEHALRSLLAICGESETARAAATSVGAVTQLLLLLQSQCGAASKAKARALLKMLRASWNGETR